MQLGGGGQLAALAMRGSQRRRPAGTVHPLAALCRKWPAGRSLARLCSQRQRPVGHRPPAGDAL